MKRFLVLLFVIASLMSGCSGSDEGAEYVGKWTNVKKPTEIIEISRNGKNFLVKLNDKTTTPGRLKDGIFVIEGVFTLTFAVDKANGNLVGMGETFARSSR